MDIRDLVPSRRRKDVPAAKSDDPFRELRSEMNRLFDDFFSDFGLAPRWNLAERETSPALFNPRVDVSETEDEVRVSAELPGMDEKDVTVELGDNAISVRGEKKEEQENKGKNWYRKEQSYGAFQRVIPLPARVEGDKAKARFKKGVLTVTLPKVADERGKRKTVTIETE